MMANRFQASLVKLVTENITSQLPLAWSGNDSRSLSGHDCGSMAELVRLGIAFLLYMKKIPRPRPHDRSDG